MFPYVFKRAYAELIKGGEYLNLKQLNEKVWI
jgi:hypothetical protein